MTLPHCVKNAKAKLRWSVHLSSSLSKEREKGKCYVIPSFLIIESAPMLLGQLERDPPLVS